MLRLACILLVISTGCKASFDEDGDDGSSSEATSEGSETGGEGGQNLLQNGDFELWSADAPAAWIVGGDASTSSDEQDPHGGQASLLAAMGPGYSSITQNVPLPEGIEAGSFIELSGYTRLVSGTGTIGVNAYLQNTEDGSDDTLALGDLASVSGDWTFGEVGALAQGKITDLRLDIVYEGAGLEVGLDDLVLTVTPPA